MSAPQQITCSALSVGRAGAAERRRRPWRDVGQEHRHERQAPGRSRTRPRPPSISVRLIDPLPSSLHSPHLARTHDHCAHALVGPLRAASTHSRRLSVCCECSFVPGPDRAECGVCGQTLVAQCVQQMSFAVWAALAACVDAVLSCECLSGDARGLCALAYPRLMTCATLRVALSSLQFVHQHALPIPLVLASAP